MSVTRRQFVTGLGAVAAGAAAAAVLPDRAGASARYTTQVAVLGGGVGGLTVAHELAERGFRVTVVEPKALGGKARSIAVPGTGRDGRANLPGEHGFRFFPGFYKNIPDTMGRIPYPGNVNGVLGNLVDATQELITFADGQQAYLLPSPDRQGLLEGAESLMTTIGLAVGVPPHEAAYAARKMLVFMTSSDARRRGEWEYVSWWDFLNAGRFSKRYQEVYGTGITKDLVAAKGHKASARTVALMGEAFIYSLMGQYFAPIRKESGYGAADRLLDAPTNEAWIDPWVAHLRSLGVSFLPGYRAARLNTVDGRIASVTLAPTRAGFDDATISADWYVAAMPVEKFTPLLSPAVLAVDPRLGELRMLETDWMNGIQFFLDRPLGVPVHGHGAYLQTPWALTSIEQGLFWKHDIAARYGDGRVRDVFSIDISDFFTPGIVYGKPAAECTPEQIATETWAQLKNALNVPGLTALTDDMVVSWFLDPAISWPDGYGKPAHNSEPLLINTTGSLDWRPDATTRIRNLFLAADYVRSNVDLATMEGANEAGRQAANAILDASGSRAAPARIGTLWQPRELDLARSSDAALYRAGLPNALDLVG